MTSSEPGAAVDAVLADRAGQVIGDYRLLRRLGQGAMAEVYLAEQQSLQRAVAVKILRANLAEDAVCVQRFRNEATAAATLVHANIVQIYEVGADRGVHFIAQEYVAGRTLGQLIERQGSLDVATAIGVLRQVSAALAKAAEHDIVHRDIKPDNILISHSGEVKVADFGLARVIGGEGLDLTQVGIALGTPLYMSPEQIEGRPLTPASDIYSLGITAYHMLVGKPPFVGDSPLIVAFAHVNQTAPGVHQQRPDIPLEIANLVARMMDKKPAQRFSSGHQLLARLQQIASDHPDATWADPTQAWSTAELAALARQHSAAVDELDDLLRRIQREQRTIPRRWKVFPAVCLAFVALGMVTSYLYRPPPLLPDLDQVEIPRAETAWEQLYHAKLVNTPAAWKSVALHHPDDTYYHHLADVGLARYYLFHDDLTAAGPVCQSLAELDADYFRAVGLAGSVIAASGQQQQEAARRATGQLTPQLLDALRQRDLQLARLLALTLTQTAASLDQSVRDRLEALQSLPEEDVAGL